MSATGIVGLFDDDLSLRYQPYYVQRWEAQQQLGPDATCYHGVRISDHCESCFTHDAVIVAADHHKETDQS